MSLVRSFDDKDETVEFLYKGVPVTPKMSVKDPEALLAGLGDALNVAYNKLRDAEAIQNSN